MRHILGTLGIALVGCATESTDTGLDTDTLAQPAVSIVSPAAGTELPDGTVEVAFVVTDFTFTRKDETAWWSPARWLPALGSALVPEARAHTPGEAPNGFAIVRLDGTVVAEITTDATTLTDVAPGPHTLSVELAYPDGDVFYPPVEATVSFTVAGGAPTFAEVQAIFDRSCTTAGCHGGPSPALGLALTSADSYANLVNVPSSAKPDMDRVEPGSSATSFLVKKLDGTFATELFLDGDLMPPGFGLAPQEIDLVVGWIDAGAQP